MKGRTKMTERTMRKFKKRLLSEDCATVGVTAPERATMKQLETLLNEYFKSAAAIIVDGEVVYRQTESPVATYAVDFLLAGLHYVNAESEEAARMWVNSVCDDCYSPYHENESVEIYESEVFDCHKCEE